MKHLLYKHYGGGSIDVLDSPIEDAFALLNKIKEDEQRNFVKDMWLVQFPHMTQETYISFDDYYKQLTNTTINKIESSSTFKSMTEEEIEQILDESDSLLFRSVFDEEGEQL